MLQLTADDKYLDIDTLSFNITLRSPINEENAGSFVYSVDIPNTNKNAKKIGFPFRLQRLDNICSGKSGEIILNNHVLLNGKWLIKKTTQKRINLEMLIDASAFANFLNNKNLPELFDVNINETDIIAHLENQITKTYPEVNYNFPTIYNPQFYGDPKETDSDKNPNTQFEGFINNYKDSFVSNNYANKNTISPQLYLAYVVKHIFAQSGYTMQSDILNDVMLQKAMLYNNFALDKLKATTFYGEFNKTTNSPDFIVIWDINLNDPGNLYNPATGEYQAKIIGTYHLKIPVTYTRNENYDYWMIVEYNEDVIASKNIIKHPGVNTELSFELNIDYIITPEIVGKYFIVKTWFTDGSTLYGIKITASIDIINVTQPMANILQGDFNYKNLVPDIPVKDFLTAFYTSFGILPFINEKTKTITLVFWKDLLTKKEVNNNIEKGLYNNTLKITANNYEGVKATFDFEGTDDFKNNGQEKENLGSVLSIMDFPLAIEGDIYFIESLNAYHQYQYNKDNGNYEIIAIGDLLPGTIKEDGKKQITFNLTPLHMRCPRNSNYAYRNLPSISAQGTSNAYNIQNNFPLRIMFWIGLDYPNPDVYINRYPFTTTVKYNTAGDIILPISWTTAEIINYYYNEWIQWLKRREGVIFTNEISIKILNNIYFQKPELFQYTHILLSEIYISIKNNNITSAKIKAWTK